MLVKEKKIKSCQMIKVQVLSKQGCKPCEQLKSYLNYAKKEFSDLIVEVIDSSTLKKIDIDFYSRYGFDNSYPFSLFTNNEKIVGLAGYSMERCKAMLNSMKDTK